MSHFMHVHLSIVVVTARPAKALLLDDSAAGINAAIESLKDWASKYISQTALLVLNLQYITVPLGNVIESSRSSQPPLKVSKYLISLRTQCRQMS